MEERYMKVSRGSSGRREAPPPRKAPAHKQAKPHRSAGASVAMGLYKVLVAVSAIIVAVYVGFTLMAKPPVQNQIDPPSPNQVGNPTTNLPGTPGDTSTGGDTGALERRKDVYTIFLAATDKGGTLTDTMMLMTYDTTEQKVGVVSIPRDTLIARGKGENPRLVYGKDGVEGRMEDVSRMLGIPIDGYIKVNIRGFITLVDYLDGIDFYIPCNMDYDDPAQDLSIHYSKGQKHLTGQQAMEVARFRKNNDSSGYSDVGRTQTQQKLLVALAKKVLAWESITKITGFVEIFNKNVDTNLTLDNMLYFANQAIDLDPSSGVQTATLPGRGDGVYHGVPYCYELDPEQALAVINEMINPYNRDMTLEDMNLTKAESYR